MKQEVEVARVKLATVISDTSAAFTGGAAVGAFVGDNVALYRRIDVKDPDSGETLGVVTLPKLRMRVTSVGPRLCVAVVTDRAPSTTGRGVPPLKTLTNDPFAEDGPRVVPVSIGEEAKITRASVDEEPPF